MTEAPVRVAATPAATALACAALAPLFAPLLLVAPWPALWVLLVDGREPSGVSSRRPALIALAFWALQIVIFGGYTALVLEILVG